jgi:hypothetical protein
MLVIEIREAGVSERQAEVRGRPATFREQVGWMTLGGETRKVKVPLGRERAAYAVGKYALDEESYGVDQFGNLVIARLVLKPAAVVAGSSAGARVAG